MTFLSSFGQTYFIGVFGPSIQVEFGLSHTIWGTVYMLGTLGSALLLPWSGKQIDHVDLKLYTVVVCVLFTGACAFMSITTGLLMLVVAVFLLRQFGQGLMSHIGVTCMARYFERERGKAIAITTTGFAAGEAILPLIAVLCIAWVGWRWTYGGLSIVLALGLVPLSLWLLRGARPVDPVLDSSSPAVAECEPRRRESWTRRQVLRDARFYLLLPGLLAPSIVLTAMFFHHLNLADEKNWSHPWITGSYIIYAIVTTFASLISGSLIDRLGAVRLLPFMLVPLALAMFLLWAFDSKWVVGPYMILAGINVGIALTATSALWAEIYGVQHLGAIKSLAQAMGVFGTALGPVIMGALVDLGLTFGEVCLAFAFYALLGAVLIRIALKRALRLM